MRLKWVFRWDDIQRFWRIARILWERGDGPGTGRGYSAKLSFALDPKLFRLPERDASTDWRFTLLGLRLHYCRSYGGRFA
jgi:hypothetical protein